MINVKEMNLNGDEYLYAAIVIAYGIAKVDQNGIELSNQYIDQTMEHLDGLIEQDSNVFQNVTGKMIKFAIAKSFEFEETTNQTLNSYTFADGVIRFIYGDAMDEKTLYDIGDKMRIHIPTLLQLYKDSIVDDE